MPEPKVKMPVSKPRRKADSPNEKVIRKTLTNAEPETTETKNQVKTTSIPLPSSAQTSNQLANAVSNSVGQNTTPNINVSSVQPNVVPNANILLVQSNTVSNANVSPVQPSVNSPQAPCPGCSTRPRPQFGLRRR